MAILELVSLWNMIKDSDISYIGILQSLFNCLNIRIYVSLKLKFIDLPTTRSKLSTTH